MRLLAIITTALVSMTLWGCFSPEAIDGTFVCTGSGASQCPPDQQCACGVCWFNPSAHSSCSAVDGATVRIDAPTVDARFVPDGPITVSPDAPENAIDAPLSVIDSPLGSPDADIAPDAKVTLIDAHVGVPDAPSPPDAPAPPDAPSSCNHNGNCDPMQHEDCLTCPSDCGVCTCDLIPLCLLNQQENCITCPQQCGVCFP